MAEDNTDVIAVHTVEIAELNRKLTALQNDVAGLKATLQRYHGFIGGVIFIISGIWLFLTQAKDVIAWLRG